jgi:hypothetical protein
MVTVRELGGFARRGGTINFSTTVWNKIHCEVNLKVVERAHVKIIAHMPGPAGIVCGER